MRKWLWLIAAVVVVLVVAGFVAIPAIRNARAAAAGCAQVKAQLKQTGALPSLTSGGRRVLVIGDSWSTGQGLATDAAAAEQRSWVATLGRAKGWEMLDDTVPYTGYVNGGFCDGQQFRTRLAGDLAARPSMVLIEGGINDTDASSSDIAAAAGAVLAGLKSVPTVVVIGPGGAVARPATDRMRVTRVLAAAAKRAGRPFIDASGWKLKFQADRLHPTQSGQDAFAGHVAVALERVR